jgi:tRNA threonylcarbamoyladenosine biosynthesis protein TsaE
MKVFSLKTPEDTRKFGNILGSVLKVGDVISLNGDLGAGKTLLSKSIAEGMGVDPKDVTSPTFAIMNVYDQGLIPIYHFDWYRLNNIDELYDTGYEEYLESNGVCIIEWAELFKEELPTEYLDLKLTLNSLGGRDLIMTTYGEKYTAISEKVDEIVNFRN